VDAAGYRLTEADRRYRLQWLHVVRVMVQLEIQLECQA